MRLLVHVCCGPCLYALLPSLRAEGHEATGFFHNPNIHPLREFRKRLTAARLVAERERLPMRFDETYGLVPFLRAVVGREDARCPLCYAMRLGRAAEETRAAGLEAFTTTLLASPHQDLEVIRRAGEEAATRAGVTFLFRDWRAEHDRAVAEAKRHSIYCQGYCGCIYSEYDRYK